MSVRLTITWVLLTFLTRSHTSTISPVSDEQRVLSIGWKSNDLTIPLCVNSYTEFAGYIYVIKSIYSELGNLSSSYKESTNEKKQITHSVGIP
jgi:hypothetical protein